MHTQDYLNITLISGKGEGNSLKHCTTDRKRVQLVQYSLVLCMVDSTLLIQNVNNFLLTIFISNIIMRSSRVEARVDNVDFISLSDKV